MRRRGAARVGSHLWTYAHDLWRCAHDLWTAHGACARAVRAERRTSSKPARRISPRISRLRVTSLKRISTTRMPTEMRSRSIERRTDNSACGHDGARRWGRTRCHGWRRGYLGERASHIWAAASTPAWLHARMPTHAFDIKPEDVNATHAQRIQVVAKGSARHLNPHRLLRAQPCRRRRDHVPGALEIAVHQRLDPTSLIHGDTRPELPQEVHRSTRRGPRAHAEIVYRAEFMHCACAEAADGPADGVPAAACMQWLGFVCMPCSGSPHAWQH